MDAPRSISTGVVTTPVLDYDFTAVFATRLRRCEFLQPIQMPHTALCPAAQPP